MPGVKSGRRYDSRGRRAHAEASRALILDVAERLFLSQGYRLTTMAMIAHAAEVSVESVYKAYGNKPGLVRAIRERALAGPGVEPAEARSDRMQREASDPGSVLQHWSTLTTEVAPRAAPILLLVRDAAGSDRDMADLLRELDQARLERMTVNAARLLLMPGVRPGLTVETAAELLWTYSSPELYELLVVRRGWDLSRYGRFIAAAMIAALIAPGPQAN